MTFNGLPLHPLVVHLAVVTVPLAALGALVYGPVARWRWALRWPLLVVTAVAALATQVSAMSGSDLQHSLRLHSAAMELHETWAGRLQAGTWVLAVVVAVAVVALPVVTRRVDALRQPASVRLLLPATRVALPVLALVELYLVYRTGDAGARLVWAHGG